MRYKLSAMPGRFSGLSYKLIATITGVILLVAVVIYFPSLAVYRDSWLQDRLRVGFVAVRVLDAVPDVMSLPRNLTDRLLASAGADAIVYRREGQSQLIELTEPVTPQIVATADMRQRDMATQILGSVDTLFAGPGRTLRIVGEGDLDESLVELLMPEAPLRRDMLDYSRNILIVSLGIASITAFVLYVLVSRLFIDPVQQLTRNVLAFRGAPENGALILSPTARNDEIGVLERELAAMENEIFALLRQRRHLADLGLAVAKINHDLRNMLTAAQLLSDQVATLEDPKVQRLAPRLVTTLGRAIDFAQSVMDYGRQSSAAPRFERVSLRQLVDDAAFDARLAGHPKVSFVNAVPDHIRITADPAMIGRVLLNLLKNAREAMEADTRDGVDRRVEVAAEPEGDTVILSVMDTGPGLPMRARENLFVAFEGSARPGGTGLGLAIARELVEAHGGRLDLVPQDQGTRFDIVLPANQQEETQES